MKPRVLVALLVAAVLGAGAEAASLPKPFSAAERMRATNVARSVSRHLPKPARWSEQRQPRHLGPTHLGGGQR
jgi:hypothetical protein